MAKTGNENEQGRQFFSAQFFVPGVKMQVLPVLLEDTRTHGACIYIQDACAPNLVTLWDRPNGLFCWPYTVPTLRVWSVLAARSFRS